MKCRRQRKSRSKIRVAFYHPVEEISEFSDPPALRAIASSHSHAGKGRKPLDPLSAARSAVYLGSLQGRFDDARDRRRHFVL